MTAMTVLTAVYNAEKYLRRCLDSLLSQTLTDIQIICVDDSSSDSSLSILHEYAFRDARIEVLPLKSNVGQARARNIALEKAKGRYVCFVDSDDYLSSDALQKAVDTFEQYPLTDAVLFRLAYLKGSSVKPHPMPPFDVMTGLQAFEASLTWKIHGVYAVKTSIHKSIPYDDSVATYSDDNTTRLHFYASKEVRCCTGTYFYRHNPASVTHAVSVRRFDVLRANESMKRHLERLHVPRRIADVYENARWLNLIDTCLFFHLHAKDLSTADAAYGIDEIKRVWQNIETHRLTFKNKFKPGYIPFRCSWKLFRMQENIYFFLRSLLHRNGQDE